MNETSSDEQGVSAGEAPQEVQRSLTTTIIETAAVLKALDVAVPDAYGAVKAAGKAVVDKIRDRAPEADPPAQDDSAELVTPSKRIVARASYI